MERGREEEKREGGRENGGKKRRQKEEGEEGRKGKTWHKARHLTAYWILWSSAIISVDEEPSSSTLSDLEHSLL